MICICICQINPQIPVGITRMVWRTAYMRTAAAPWLDCAGSDVTAALSEMADVIASRDGAFHSGIVRGKKEFLNAVVFAGICRNL